MMQSQQAATSLALAALLPAYTRPSFPQELLTLCASLYGRSRSRAATLKADEEVARGYACCHLACERLKQRLNLPDIVPRPPCGPRVYKKLYAFLDKAIPVDQPSTPRKGASRYDAVASTPGTGTSVGRTSTKTPTSQAIGPPDSVSAQGTPTPSRFPAATPSHMPERKRRRIDEGGDVLASLKKRSDAPEWLHGATQHLGKKFECPPAAIHVYEGVCEVSKGKRLAEEEMASLVVAVLLIVLQRMGKLQDIESSYTAGVREMVALRKVVITRMGAVITDVERWIDEEADDWKQALWYDAVPEKSAAEVVDPALLGLERASPLPPVPRQLDFGVPRRQPEAQPSAPIAPMQQSHTSPPPPPADIQPQADDFEMEEVEFEQEPGSMQPQQAQLQKKQARNVTSRGGGLGTMVQSANDWLSEERRAEFVVWKSKMMRQVNAIERQQSAV